MTSGKNVFNGQSDGSQTDTFFVRRKTVVITGASGRLGLIFAQHFSNSPFFKVFLVSTQKRAGYLSYEEMLSDKFLQQTDIILHLAWSSVPRISEDKFGEEWLQDIPLLVRMLQAIGNGQHNHIQLIFFSSAGAIYSNCTENPAKEDTPCSPANMYGWSKLHAEQLIAQYSHRCCLAATVVRITNIYGMGSRNNDQQGVIPYLIKAALNGDEMYIWGDGTARKDYLHIDDLLEVIGAMVNRRILGLFNVGYGKSYSLSDLITIVEQLSKSKISLKYTKAFPWDNAQVAVSNDKLQKALSWKPRVTIEEGIKNTLELLKCEILNIEDKTMKNRK